MSQKSKIKKYQVPYDEKHTTIPNRLIVDKNLSDSGFRFLAYLFSNSDEWTVYVGHTRKLMGWGKEKMENTMTHVIKLGYVRRELVREKGKFSHYDYTYHHKPIFLGLSDDLPVEALQPQAVKPPTVKPTAANQPLPMPKRPMPNLHGNVGNAPLPPKDSNQGFEKAMPSSIEEFGSGGFVLIPSTTRKFKRSEEHQKRFDYIMSLRLTDKFNRVSEDEMSFLSHKYSMKQLEDAHCHLEYKMSTSNFKPESLIAVFKHLLKNEHCPVNANCLENAKHAKSFAEEMGWRSLVIKAKYVEDKNYPGKDIPLNLEPMAFFESLCALHSSLNG